ncbi:MAG: AAA family ATPase [Pseudomonadota bacterium]
MNITSAIPVLNAALNHDTPICMWGLPGIGKSKVAAQVAKARGAVFLDIRLNIWDPVDLRGLPAAVDGKTVWLRPGVWPTDETVETVLCFDEIDRAPLAVQNAALQIVLDRKIGEHSLPASCRILAAGNGKTDRTGTNKISGAMANRFAHLNIEPDSDAWIDWAVRSGSIDPALVAFIRFRPTFIHGALMVDEHTGAPLIEKDALSYPSSRAWEEAAKYLSEPEEVRGPMTAAIVGNAPAAEFAAFLTIMRQLPSVDSIVASPMGAIVPTMPAALYAVSTALARRAARDHASFASVGTYAARLPREFEILTMLDASKRAPALKETAPYVAWAIRNAATLS